MNHDDANAQQTSKKIRELTKERDAAMASVQSASLRQFKQMEKQLQEMTAERDNLRIALNTKSQPY